MNTIGRCTRTGIRLAIGLEAAVSLFPLASGSAFAATADIEGGLNTFSVHVSDLASKSDKCLVFLDNRPDPFVGSPAQEPGPNGGFVAKYENMVVGPGSHSVRVTCTDKDDSTLLNLEETITVGEQEGTAPGSPSTAKQFSGTYIAKTNVEHQTWKVNACGDGCAHIEASGDFIKNWTADAKLADGAWTWMVDRPDAVYCIRQRGAGTAHYSIDAALTGGSVVVDVAADNICGKPVETLAAEGIALTKTG
jgi:hypothetical protein